MKLSTQIRALHAKGRTPDKIAAKLDVPLKYVNQVIGRIPGAGRGVADKARKLADYLSYDAQPDDESRERVMRDIASQLGCSLQEVELALSRPPTRGRPPAPLCEACGQTLRGEALERHRQHQEAPKAPKLSGPCSHCGASASTCAALRRGKRPHQGCCGEHCTHIEQTNESRAASRAEWENQMGVVRHKNGDPTNNSIDNLEIVKAKKT